MNINFLRKISLVPAVFAFIILFGLLPLNKAKAFVETPSMLVSSPRDEGAFLQWIGTPDATDYVVEYKETSGTNWTTFSHPASTTSGIFVNNLNNNTSYDFRVSTISPEGQSEPTPVSSATPLITAVHNSNNQIIATGQSNAMGTYNGTPLSTTQPYSNLMLNYLATSFIPLVEPITGGTWDTAETMSSSMANSITNMAQPEIPNYVSIVSLNAISGAPYVDLMQGTYIYNHALGDVTAAKGLSLAENKTLVVPAVTVIHGEGDEGLGTSADQYEEYLLEWQNDYQNDIRAITGQSEPVLLFTDQVSSWLTNWTTPHVALGQYQAAKNHPDKIILVTPKYIFDFVDSIHLTNYSQRRLGEYYAKVYKKVVIDGEQWSPLMPTNITLSGNVITATFHVPVPPLTLDFSGAAFNYHFGFEYKDSLNSASIWSVTITGPDTIEIILGNVPTGTNPRLRYAYTGSGPWAGSQSGGAGGNLRDSDMTEATHQDAAVPTYMGNYLHNWMVTFDEPITVIPNVPSEPTSVSATPGSANGTAVVSFDPPTYVGASPIFTYFVFDASAPGNILVSGASSPITVTGLSNNTTYTFIVTAVNNFGQSIASLPSNSVYIHWPTITDAPQLPGKLEPTGRPPITVKPERKSRSIGSTTAPEVQRATVIESVPRAPEEKKASLETSPSTTEITQTASKI